MLDETPFFFTGPAGRLFGVLHKPVNRASGVPFVFCHPFVEEKLWSHRVLVSTARRLAEAGHPVLRFDGTGYGDSGGEFRDTTLTSARADIEAAIDELRGLVGAPRVALLGLRLGATMAATVAERRSDVDRLVCWSPIFDGSAYLLELLRINVATQLAAYREVRDDRETLLRQLETGKPVNVDGYDLGPDMAAELRALRFGGQAPSFSGPVLLVHTDRNANAAPSLDLQKLRTAYVGAELAVVQEEPFWKEINRFYGSAQNLSDATVRWLGGVE